MIKDREVISYYIGREVILSATISDMPEQKNSQTRLKINDVSINYSANTLKSQIYVMLAGQNSDVERSDRITMKAALRLGFGNYTASVYRPVIIAIDKPDPPDYSATIRNNFTTHLRALFHQSSTADLALGFLVGEKTLPDELSKQLKLVGLSHIVVASGFSLSVLINFAKKHFQKVSRFAGFAAAVILMVLFLTITGLSPSLLRASLVSGLVLVASYYGRTIHPGRLFAYVVAISAIINPTIITNVAWQLSFASYAGIIIFTPLVKKYLYGRARPGIIAEMIIVSFSAQLFCLPISLYNFGQFSIIGILANILVTPIIPCIMMLTLLSGTLPIVIASPLVFLDNVMLSYQITIIQNLSSIKWAVIEFGAKQPYVFLLYIPIMALSFALKRRTRHCFKPSLALDNSPKYGKIYPC